MARLFTCGFEENNFTATMWSLSTGTTPTIATDQKHSGTYALKCATSGSTALVARYLANVVTAGSLYYRLYLYIANDPSADVSLFENRNQDAATKGVALQYITASQVLRLKNFITATVADFSSTISPATWYRVEIEHAIANVGGSMTARLYAGDSTTLVEEQSITNEDTLPGHIQNNYFGVFLTNSTSEVWFDDIAINDSADPGDGSNMSWCGPGKIALVYPDTDTATIEWTPNTGTDHANLVDDVPGTPDDATTYNGDTQATNIDRLNVSALPAEVTSDADILLVDVYARVGNNSTTGSPSMLLYLWDEGGTLTPGPSLSTDINGWRICATNEHLVYNAGSKTKDNVNNFDLGYKGNTADGRNKWITALWANVEWIEAAAPTNKAGGLVNTIHCKSLVAGGLVG